MKAGSEKKLLSIETIAKMVELGVIKADTQAIPDFDKEAGTRCQHQRHGKGCAVYERRPFGCRFWNCRWLVSDDTADLPRPDRAHYVIDLSPDFVLLDGNVMPVVQVWLDPKYPDAHKDPKLRAYLERRAQEGHAALIRMSNIEAFVLFAPAIAGGEWVEKHSSMRETEHTAAEKVAALGAFKIVLKENAK